MFFAFLQSPVMQTLRWMRIPGDTIFAVGAVVLVAFVFFGRKGGKQAQEMPQGVRVPAGD